jgi:hypothetical protein
MKANELTHLLSHFRETIGDCLFDAINALAQRPLFSAQLTDISRQFFQ